MRNKLMGRRNNGVVKLKNDGFWHGRVRWTDENGKPYDYKLKPERTESAAWRAVHKKQADLLEKGVEGTRAEKMTFSTLAKEYKEAKLFEAKIVDGKKVGGMKSLEPQLCNLEALKEYFSNKRIQSITPADLENFKYHRLETPTRYSGQRKIASVNRELELARAMFNFAILRRWLIFNPFIGARIIERSAETQRDRILSTEEQTRLLDALRKTNKYGRQGRAHLIPLLLVSWHTAARRGELLSLKWQDVNFNAGTHGTILVTVDRCKTQRQREIPLSPTASTELRRLWEASSKNLNDLVFGYKFFPKKVFSDACKEAGIENYRWHDNRHTGTTMMVDKTSNPILVQKITGHTQDSTFRRYYNPSVEKLATVTDALG